MAVPAAVLVTLGFAPFRAALICLLANTVAVAFGVVGIPVITLAWITDLPATELAIQIVLQLTAFVIIVPVFIVTAVTGSMRGLSGVWIHALGAGAAFGVVQFITARHIGTEPAANEMARSLPAWTWPPSSGPGRPISCFSSWCWRAG